MLPVLYSLTSLGQTQTWSIEFSGGKFRTTEGIKGGAMTVSEWTVCEGKNLGKANETSPEVQAEKEARAKWKKKTESGYWENEADIHKAKFFEPMLAHKWVDYSWRYHVRSPNADVQQVRHCPMLGHRGKRGGREPRLLGRLGLSGM